MRHSIHLAALGALFLHAAMQSLQAAPFAYVAEAGTSRVRVIDMANDAVVAHIGVGHGPRSLVLNRMGTRAYVTNSGEATVSVIETASNRVIATIAVGESPAGIAVNSTGTRIYVARSGRYPDYKDGAVAVIDGDTHTVIATLAAGKVPRALALTPDGTRLYVANVVSEDISVIDTRTHLILATIPVGSPAEGDLAIDAAGSRVYATLPFAARLIAIDTTTQSIVGSMNASWDPLAIALDAAGTRAYVTDVGSDFVAGRTLYVIDTASLAVVATVPVGSAPRGVFVDPSNGRIYVMGTESDSVSVIDGATHAVTKTLPVGRFPLSMGIGPADAVPAGGNYQGLWWNSPAGSESGWGVNLTHQGDILFGTWSTYDADGSALWLVMPNGAKTGPSTYSGALFRMTGSPPDATSFASSATPVGNATFAFTQVDAGAFTYTVNGTTQSKSIVRYEFATPMPVCTAGGRTGATPSYQDLWWRAPAGSQPGWGVNITHQGGILFATWFTYDANGKAQWLVMSKGVRSAAGNAYSGALYRMTGPAFDASPWNPTQVTATPAGTATFILDEDLEIATFSYTLDGVSRSQPITRYVFSSPATVCR